MMGGYAAVVLGCFTIVWIMEGIDARWGCRCPSRVHGMGCGRLFGCEETPTDD